MNFVFVSRSKRSHILFPHIDCVKPPNSKKLTGGFSPPTCVTVCTAGTGYQLPYRAAYVVCSSLRLVSTQCPICLLVRYAIQCSKFVTFGTDPDADPEADPAPDPALSVSDLQDVNKNMLIPFKGTFTSFFKNKRSYRCHITVEIKIFLHFLLVDRRIRIRTNKLRFWMRSQGAKKRISGYGILVRMLLPLFVSGIANPPHKLATPALVHIGAQTLATPCMYRTHTIFTFIYVHVRVCTSPK
jgi:hypothetical protein